MTGSNDGLRTRRQLLASLGAVSGVAVAGCSALPWEDDETASSLVFSPSEAETVLEDDEPTIEWPVPIRPDESALEAGLERVDALVAAVPDPLESEDVPNGVVRESIVESHDEATTTRDEAADATGAAQYHALHDSRNARESARTAATAWLTVDADRESLVVELRDERDTVDEAVTDRLETIEYRGSDADEGLCRAALYYARLEDDCTGAQRSLERWSVSATDDVLEIGESAGSLEAATATTAVWEHLEERWREDEGDADLGSIFEDALERSVETTDEVGFPDHQEGWLEEIGLGDLDDQFLEFALYRARQPVDRAQDGMEAALRDGNLATGLYHALEFEVAYRGFEILRDRIADGDVRDPSIEDVRAERQDALAATQQVREADFEGGAITEPSLGAYILAETLQSLEWNDESVRRVVGRDPETNVLLSSQYRDYLRYRSHLEALPDAIEAFRGRLLA
ncbi:hypothetical protein [Natronobacterium gregoryi]|uniref:Transposase n=2 Tax=Natronobacterium gregoryi TaxID=44930 RepID=L0ABP9_NATGS|nr:hypothetical protein [Natronobacterium gregoryi]AFZ71323.1 hypothetical protein Natgr_0053 [Natronobacterium gregoryi SP2]ELY67212.1 hypothetical protein C490_11431 [Natronobacterium gregoryi SP2]PLK19169.1 transposase [Natronobacterium gregoryi SP2]SFJ59098.1 hypothetical protein SAMN05443661_14326 [Natronobacterium gregoryi]